jgi:enediyne biosynthesis protein E4
VQGVSYPVATRDELLSQITPLRKIFVKYADYADARMEDIFSEPLLKKAQKLHINTLSTSYIQNLGGGKFSIKKLPIEAQFSMTNGLLADDFNLDGNTDLLLSGNFYPYRVQSGPSDAGMGLLLTSDGKGNFKTMPNTVTGLCATGDVRDMVSLKSEDGHWIVVAKNNAALQVLKCK